MTKETLQLLEGQIQTDLQRISNFDDDQANRSKVVQDVTKLIEKLTEAESSNEKFVDNAERRDIDRKRNESTVALERQKQNLDWKRMSLEILKVAVPVIVPLFVWRKSFKEMVTFEETGRFTSSASRELHLPRIFNK